MNPRSRRGDRRRWRSQQVPDERGHVGAPRTGVASDGPKGPPPDPYVPFFGRKGPLPFERRIHPGATFSARRRVLLYLHAIRRGHATGRGEFLSAALREGGGGLPGNVEGLGLREPEKVDPARQDRRTLRFRKEDIDRYIASQTVAPLNTKDIRSPISLREKMREPRSLCCFLLGSSTVIVSRSATLMTFPPVWVSPFASQGRAVHTCEPEISQSVRFYEKRGFGEKPKYRRYELALLRQGFGGHPSRMACHPKLRSLGFAVATSSEGWCRRGDSTDEAPAFSPSPSRPAPRVSPPPPQAEPAL